MRLDDECTLDTVCGRGNDSEHFLECLNKSSEMRPRSVSMVDVMARVEKSDWSLSRGVIHVAKDEAK